MLNVARAYSGLKWFNCMADVCRTALERGDITSKEVFWIADSFKGLFDKHKLISGVTHSEVVKAYKKGIDHPTATKDELLQAAAQLASLKCFDEVSAASMLVVDRADVIFEELKRLAGIFVPLVSFFSA